MTLTVARSVVLLAAVVLWLVLRPAERTPATKPTPIALSESPGPRYQSEPAQVPATRSASTDEPMEDGEEDGDDLQKPHPITPEHERIFKENNLLGAMNGALDVGDYEALRRMNARYREEYPEDGHVLQEAYDLIADCLENNTPTTQAAAERFWRTHRASQLRRYVRRHCLSGKVPQSL